MPDLRPRPQKVDKLLAIALAYSDLGEEQRQDLAEWEIAHLGMTNPETGEWYGTSDWPGWDDVLEDRSR